MASENTVTDDPRHPSGLAGLGGSRDFDFQIGLWRVKHRCLKTRLTDSDEWDEFDGTCQMATLLGGKGNIEDNVLNIGSGPYRAVALRSYDLDRGCWAIWWLDGRTPHTLDVPVKGSFEGGIGSFYANDSIEGLKVRIRFLWTRTDTPTPRWEQAMSIDGGDTWETNWIMDFERDSIG